MNPIKILTVILYFLVCTGINCQNIFILEKPGTIKYFKYTVNDRIKLKTIGEKTLISGRISKISDSSIVVNSVLEIPLKDIDVIHREQFGFSLLQKVFLSAGIPYLAISMINGAINNDNPIVTEETLIISGSLITAGAALTPLVSRKFKIDNQKWRVKILDFSD
ncbi:MAG: hypothetical protein R2764_25215 [Bacteroidales bacterium]